jgi:hypothetical protein
VAHPRRVRALGCLVHSDLQPEVTSALLYGQGRPKERSLSGLQRYTPPRGSPMRHKFTPHLSDVRCPFSSRHDCLIAFKHAMRRRECARHPRQFDRGDAGWPDRTPGPTKVASASQHLSNTSSIRDGDGKERSCFNRRRVEIIFCLAINAYRAGSPQRHSTTPESTMYLSISLMNVLATFSSNRRAVSRSSLLSARRRLSGWRATRHPCIHESFS